MTSCGVRVGSWEKEDPVIEKSPVIFIALLTEISAQWENNPDTSRRRCLFFLLLPRLTLGLHRAAWISLNIAGEEITEMPRTRRAAQTHARHKHTSLRSDLSKSITPDTSFIKSLHWLTSLITYSFEWPPSKKIRREEEKQQEFLGKTDRLEAQV